MERWRQIEEMFHAALELAPHAREAYLKEACKTDESLRQEVDSLLTAYEQPTDHLKRPALFDGLQLLASSGESLHALKKGDRVGRYEILDELGAGGMGEVYLARDPGLGRKVAIKVLPDGFVADKQSAERLLAEGRAASTLNHPNILTVHEIGETSGRPYLVTEYVQGTTLRERLRGGPISSAEAVRIAAQVASALAASHAAGILHRDIKPENLMLRPDGLVKILDFGLAKALQQSPAETNGALLSFQTQHGRIAGSVPYMSPEQVRGDELDPRTDLWSLGVVLYELLTGQPPFGACGDLTSKDRLMQRIQHETPPLVQKLCPEVPARVARVVDRCLAKNPADRFGTITEMKSALEISVARHLRPGTVLAAAGALAVTVIALERFSPAPGDPPSFQYLTYSGHDSSPAVSPDGRTIVFTSDRDGEPRIWLKRMGDGAEVAVTTGPDDAPRFSPDGRTVLFIRRVGSHTSLFRASIAGGEQHQLVDNVVGADYAPNGLEIGLVRWENSPAFTGSIVGTVKSEGSGPVKELARVPLRNLGMPRWSPDGKHIATVHSIGAFGSEVVVIGRDGKVSVLDPQTELSISGPAWLGSGHEIVYVRGDFAASSKADLVRHSLRSNELTPLHKAWPYHSHCLDILGDGRVVFDTSSRRSNLREVQPGGGDGQWLTRGTSMDRQPVFSPDGGRLAFTSDRSGNTDIWQIDLHTHQFAKLTDHPGDDMDPAYTPEGNGIIWTSNRSGHLEIHMADRGGGHPRRVTDDGSDAQNATMTANGKWIVYTSSHPTKRGIWKIHPDGSGAEQIISGTHFNPEVSPDGKHALYLTSLHPAANVIRVLQIEDGTQEPFEIVCDIRKPTQVLIGRARWGSESRTILFIGQDKNGVHGIFEQPFTPSANTDGLRRRVAAFDPDMATESFGISRDGRMIVGSWDQLSSVIIGERISGVTDALRGRIAKIIP